MKNTLFVLVLVLAVSCKTKETKPKEPEVYNIGQKSVTYTDESRNRPIVTEIWYPTLDSVFPKDTAKKQKDVFKPMKVIPNATVVDKKFPLLLVSHGTGGNRFSLTWFAEKMVKEGYIVVSLDHFGNSTWNKIPREFLKWWERAIDIQFLLTNVLKDETLATKIDTSKIGGVGFSLGGYTSVALAGGYVDRTLGVAQPLPPEFPKTDEKIDVANDSLILASYNKYKDQVKDDRIKAFFTIAPAIGFAFNSEKQTETISAPIFIVAGKGDTNTPVKENAEVFDKLIKTSTLHLFNEHVNHYTFLNEGTAFGKEVIPDLTNDHPSVNRGEIHAETVELAKKFFKENL